jgi:hypothetical protein
MSVSDHSPARIPRWGWPLIEGSPVFETTDPKPVLARASPERLVTTRLEGDSLILVVEGSSSGSQDPQLLHLLSGAVPAGTPVVVNRVPGARTEIGDVGL